jgi:hypothetical protein
MELIEELINNRDQELVLRSLGVESVVVDAEMPGHIRLPLQENGGGKWRCVRPDDTLVEHGGALVLELNLLQLQVAGGSNGDGRGT